jgi:hypothetical protein
MRKITSMVIGLAMATILTTYIAAHTLSNQAFAQRTPVNPNNPNNPNNPANLAGVEGFGDFGASNSGHVVHSGLPGQIQTHPVENYARAIGIQIQPFIRNLLIPAAQQHFYDIGSGIGVLHKFTP